MYYHKRTNHRIIAFLCPVISSPNPSRLTHLTTLDALEATLARLFAQEATAQSGQTGTQTSMALLLLLRRWLLVLHLLLHIVILRRAYKTDGPSLERAYRRGVLGVSLRRVSLGRRVGTLGRVTIIAVSVFCFALAIRPARNKFHATRHSHSNNNNNNNNNNNDDDNKEKTYAWGGGGGPP